MNREEAEQLAAYINAAPGWRVEEITPPAGLWPDVYGRHHVVHAWHVQAQGAFSVEYAFGKPAQWAVTRIRQETA